MHWWQERQSPRRRGRENIFINWIFCIVLTEVQIGIIILTSNLAIILQNCNAFSDPAISPLVIHMRKMLFLYSQVTAAFLLLKEGGGEGQKQPCPLTCILTCFISAWHRLESLRKRECQYSKPPPYQDSVKQSLRGWEVIHVSADRHILVALSGYVEKSGDEWEHRKLKRD